MADPKIIASAREAVRFLLDEADFNRSWIDGRRGRIDPSEDIPRYVARRIEIAEERERWAAAIDALIVDAPIEALKFEPETAFIGAALPIGCDWCASNDDLELTLLSGGLRLGGLHVYWHKNGEIAWWCAVRASPDGDVEIREMFDTVEEAQSALIVAVRDAMGGPQKLGLEGARQYTRASDD